MIFLAPAHKPDSKGHPRGAGKVCRGPHQQTGGRAKGERGSGETRGATEESSIGKFIWFPTPVSHV